MNKKIVKGFMMALLAVGFSGCLDSFEDLNRDRNSLYADNLAIPEIQKLLLKPQFEIYSSNANMYQYGYNLHVDLFSGYFATPHSFGNNCNNTYKLRPDFNHGPLELLLLKILPNTRLVIEAAQAKELPQYAAMARIMQAISASYATDAYGPIPYKSAKLGEAPYYYDSQEEVYAQLFEELETSVNELTTYLKENPNGAVTDNLVTFDKMCGGKYENWIKLANSFRFRLAMRIVKVNPALAKTIAEAAVKHEIGVFAPTDADVETKDSGTINPLWQMSVWGDTSINASLESILKGYNHPFIGKIMAPISGVITDIEGNPAVSYPFDPLSSYHGVRFGISSVPGDKASTNQYVKMSQVGLPKESPLPIFKVAEISFLKAEAVLRGWNVGGGSAEALYKEGVKVAMSRYGVVDNDILSMYLETTTGGFPYKDLYDNANSIPDGDPLLNDVPVKWDNAASNEKKLQQIITQKWIGNYPLSFEAWAEFRRTGYPKIFPVKVNDSNGLIDTKIQIRRLPFTKQERDTNNDEVTKAESMLKGADTGGTRLWWDEDKANF